MPDRDQPTAGSERSSGRPQQQKPALGVKGRFPLNGALFNSASEAACGALLEKYVPGFKVEPGKSFQVPIAAAKGGGMCCVDFLVRDVLLEYHPPRLWRHGRRAGDFKDHVERRSYYRLRKKLPPEGRARMAERMKAVCTRRYYQARRDLADSNPEHAGRELIVVTSPQEFYDKVLLRFGRGQLPTEAEFVEAFKQLRCQAAKDAVRSSKKGKRSKKRGSAGNKKGGGSRPDRRGGRNGSYRRGY